MDIYVVKAEDTLYQIAASYGVTMEEVAFINQLIPPYSLAIGQALLLPSAMETVIQPEIKVNGYAYPFISNWVLQQTLPYLTELSVFSYGFTAERELIPPQLDDSWMIDQAIKEETLPILTLTPFGPGCIYVICRSDYRGNA